jgi:hypothetical protein
MDQLTNSVVNVYKWAKSDFHSWPTRFVLEISAWFMSIGCAITMAATLPHPPFLILYPIFIAQCIIFAWSAWTRKSTGLVANYLLLVSIDAVGLIRLISIQ